VTQIIRANICRDGAVQAMRIGHRSGQFGDCQKSCTHRCKSSYDDVSTKATRGGRHFQRREVFPGLKKRIRDIFTVTVDKPPVFSIGVTLCTPWRDSPMSFVDFTKWLIDAMHAHCQAKTGKSAASAWMTRTD
jgi:hypothetical protein